MCPGLGTTTCCFLGHAGLLEYAGVEEEAAREGEEGTSNHFTSEHQTRAAGFTGPDETSQQSGNHSFVTDIHPHYVPFLAHAEFGGSDTITHKICFAFLYR